VVYPQQSAIVSKVILIEDGNVVMLSRVPRPFARWDYHIRNCLVSRHRLILLGRFGRAALGDLAHPFGFTVIESSQLRLPQPGAPCLAMFETWDQKCTTSAFGRSGNTNPAGVNAPLVNSLPHEAGRPGAAPFAVFEGWEWGSGGAQMTAG